jgi:GTP-binding protein
VSFLLRQTRSALSGIASVLSGGAETMDRASRRKTSEPRDHLPPIDIMKPHTVELVRVAGRREDFIRDDRPQVAFVGRSNVGKSSLLNRLIGQKIAHTSSTPGRTRTINFFLVDRRAYFVDLPGYGYAKISRQDREQWSRLIDQYFASAPPGVQVVLLVDARIGGSPLDAEAARYLLGHSVSLTVAATKIDKISRNARQKALKSVADLLELPSPVRIVPISSQTGEGLDQLWKELALTKPPTD